MQTYSGSITNRLVKLCVFLVVMASSAEQGLSQDALSSKLVLELKKGHIATCVPNIKRQVQATGIDVNAKNVELYCECLANFYFNDFTTADFEELKLRQDLPERVRVRQKKIQEHCANSHLY